jgi:hypothetical protein
MNKLNDLKIDDINHRKYLISSKDIQHGTNLNAVNYKEKIIIRKNPIKTPVSGKRETGKFVSKTRINFYNTRPTSPQDTPKGVESKLSEVKEIND